MSSTPHNPSFVDSLNIPQEYKEQLKRFFTKRVAELVLQAQKMEHGKAYDSIRHPVSLKRAMLIFCVVEKDEHTKKVIETIDNCVPGTVLPAVGMMSYEDLLTDALEKNTLTITSIEPPRAVVFCAPHPDAVAVVESMFNLKPLEAGCQRETDPEG